MVDFNQLIQQESHTLEVEPGRLFGSLQRKRGYEYLRDVQRDVLDEWHRRRDEPDSVIKMNTGAGKTLVGLLILQSRLNEGKGPALYLCPNTHLVSQVEREAKSFGIKCVVSGRGETLPVEFLESKAILVTTIHKLFNGRSIFQVAGAPDPVPVGLVLVDDAHTCINIAHEQFTAEFSKSSSVGKSLAGFFDDAMQQQSVGLYADIVQGKRNAYIRIPYWAWQERLQDVAALFSKNEGLDELRFTWPFLKSGEVLSNSTAVISGDRVEVAPNIIPIDLVPSFAKASHRVYMSATLLDDAALIKDFAADPASVTKPIKPNMVGDIGERLIISPSLVEQSIEGIVTAHLVSEIQSNHSANVVVLVPSIYRGQFWKSNLPNVMSVPDMDISDVIERLSNSKSNTVTFANRYDGIDLPDNACRILVLDGLPHEPGLIRLSEANARQASPIIKRQIAQRIEQGMGRGVRSRADYCVVLLVGGDLLSFMTRVDNQPFFTEDTKRQIEMGKGLSALLKEDNKSSNAYQAVIGVVAQCLNRDAGWLAYHQQNIQDTQTNQAPVSSTNIELASVELSAWQFALRGQYYYASAEISRIVNEKLSPEADFGWYLQVAAGYHYHLDRVEALDKQIKAYDLNDHLLKPLEGVTYRKVQAKNTSQSREVLNWVQAFTEPNSLRLKAEGVFENLTFGIGSNDFEQALSELAQIMGFQAQRPDEKQGYGPDVLWRMTDGHYLVIEVKNQVELGRSAIYKREAAQLGQHGEWFKREYPNLPYTPVLIHPSATLERGVYLAEGTKVVQADDLNRIVEAVRGFVKALTSKPTNSWSQSDIQRLLTEYGLLPMDFLNKFLRKEAK